MDWDDDDYGVDLTEEDIENIQFEQLFYELIAGTSLIEVLPIPDVDGSVMSSEDLQSLQEECKKRKITVLYRISHGKVATIFDPKSLKVGVVPEFSFIGFPC